MIWISVNNMDFIHLVSTHIYIKTILKMYITLFQSYQNFHIENRFSYYTYMRQQQVPGLLKLSFIYF